MKKAVAILLLTTCGAAPALAQEALPIQLFACELNEGKTMENVMALAEAYRTAWPAMGEVNPNRGAFVWTSFRGATPYDYVVGFIDASLTSMVSGLQNYYGSGLGAGLDAQFADTGDCISAIVFSEQIRNGEIGQTGDDQPDALVETFSCTLNDGFDMSNVEQAEAFWRGKVAELDSVAVNTFDAYRWTTYRGGTGDSDFTWVGNYPDIGTWAQGEEDWIGSPQGQASDEYINNVATCVSSLWSGYWIVPPTAGPTAE